MTTGHGRAAAATRRSGSETFRSVAAADPFDEPPQSETDDPLQAIEGLPDDLPMMEPPPVADLDIDQQHHGWQGCNNPLQSAAEDAILSIDQPGADLIAPP